MPSVSTVDPAGTRTTTLLACGILAPFAYIGTDIVASALYPGYSFSTGGSRRCDPERTGALLSGLQGSRFIFRSRAG
jgi:hypothetical protein